MKRLLFLIVIFCAIKANAQTHLISFAGTGGSNTLETVKVENLMSGTTLTMNGNDILRLNIVTGLNVFEDNQSSGLKIYPNPVNDKSTLEKYPPVAGDATISVYDMTGKLLAQNKYFLENSLQRFSLSGLKSGFYLISVTGKTFQHSAKLLSNGTSNGEITIEKIASYSKTVGEIPEKVSRSMEAIVDMNYSTGDRLKFTGTTGIYSTVKTDIPLSDKTITFNFIACTDGDNNNYPVVEIGSQVWMAENLKTTSYQNSDFIGTTSPGTLDIGPETMPKYQWAYDGNESYVSTYGRLYTWYAITDSRNVCPTGWHVPADDEWLVLSDYLSGEVVAGGKLKEVGTTHWLAPNKDATNETGFTALPAGARECCNPGILFNGLSFCATWWSTTESLPASNNAYSRGATRNWSNFDRTSLNKRFGNSIRCLKN